MISNRPKLNTGQRPNIDLEQNGLITCDILIEYVRHKTPHAIWLNYMMFKIKIIFWDKTKL